MSYLLQLTFTENPTCAGNATVSKTWSKHPLKGSGCRIDYLNIALAGQERSLYKAPVETRNDLLEEMPLPSCVTLGKIFHLSVLQFSRL